MTSPSNRAHFAIGTRISSEPDPSSWCGCKPLEVHADNTGLSADTFSTLSCLWPHYLHSLMAHTSSRGARTAEASPRLFQYERWMCVRDRVCWLVQDPLTKKDGSILMRPAPLRHLNSHSVSLSLFQTDRVLTSRVLIQRLQNDRVLDLVTEKLAWRSRILREHQLEWSVSVTMEEAIVASDDPVQNLIHILYNDNHHCVSARNSPPSRVFTRQQCRSHRSARITGCALPQDSQAHLNSLLKADPL